jgi:hypothetical protein
MVELRPLPIVGLSNVTVGRVLVKGTRRREVLRSIKRDLLEMTMVECDGSECHDDPFDALRFALKCYIFELYRFGKVDRSCPRFAYKQF